MFYRLPVVMYVICIGVGLLGVVVSFPSIIASAEESLGLHLLYMLRGPVTPRSDVMVIALDRKSAETLNLPLAPFKWPRLLHTRLLQHLAAQQAEVVAFDLLFHEPRESIDDQAFADAIHTAGNVVLTQTIDRHAFPLSNENSSRTVHLNIEKIVSAIPVLADAAAGQGPFPLPKVPVKLNQYWCFCPGSGYVPTLPVVAFHIFAADAFFELIRLLHGMELELPKALSISLNPEYTSDDVMKMIPPLRSLFKKESDLESRILKKLDNTSPDQISARTKELVRSFVGLYAHGNSRYLNLYGPPNTISSISYHRFFSSKDSDSLPSLKDKAVFVGQTEGDMFKVGDGFYTVFTEKTGADISGVEIAATAFSNLLENKSIYPLKGYINIALLLGWGILSAFIGLHFSTTISATGLVLFNSVYLAIAHYQFTTKGIWCPLVVPILVQMPVAFITGLIWKYRQVSTERENIREAFGHYLPDDVVDRLVADVKELIPGGQVSYGICLFTDVQNYTTLAESMYPDNLARLMNAYYAAVFKPIKANSGIVLQVIGDSVLALWKASKPRNELKKAACRAAIEITAAVDRFNMSAGLNELPTRIGIHAGELLLGNIGAMDHFEYRPVGDSVNTASRLEGLNKFLGTHTLVSQEAFPSNHDVSARLVGRFIFKGKSQPVQVYELLQNKLAPKMQDSACRLFASGLAAFVQQQWDEADNFFNQVLQIDGNDGPSRFYLGLSREYRVNSPGDDWDGTIPLAKK